MSTGRRLLIFLLVLLTPSCAAKQPQVLQGPKGGALHAVACIEPVDNCYLDAIKLCPNGFTTVDAVESPAISFDEGIPLLKKRYTLQVECK